jgi:hypothetical protein
MNRFAFTLVVLASLAAIGLAARPESNPPAANAPDAEAERTIHAALQQPAHLEFAATPLKDVVQDLKNRCHIEIQLDLPALKEAGINESTPVTFKSRPMAVGRVREQAKDAPLRTGLKSMLDPMRMQYVVRNGAVWITAAPTPEERIREALDQPTQIEFVDTPLKDVVDYLQDLHHIEIQLDAPALKEAGVEESTPVNENLKGISLRSALHLVLGECGLKFVIHNEVLLITNSAKADSEEYMETRAYPVQDLVLPDRDGAVDLQPLKEVLTRTVAPNRWAANKGSGRIAEFVVGDRPLLMVSQTQEVHEQIDRTLELLRKAGGLKTAAEHAAADEAAERRIREALDGPAQLEFVDTPLKDVIDYLKDLHHIEIQLDGPALKEAGVEESTPVTKNLKRISLRSALKLLLDELQFKCVDCNGVLLITSPTRAQSNDLMQTRIYPVADLVRPDQRGGAPDLQPLKDVLKNTTPLGQAWPLQSDEQRKAAFARLLGQTGICSQPDGDIAGIVVGNRPLLVVWETQDVHEQIQATLELLRKAGGLKGPDAASPKANVIHLKKHEDAK